jgi:hypothetical protein
LRTTIHALFGNKEGDILPARTSILALFGNKEADNLPEQVYWHCLVIRGGYSTRTTILALFGNKRGLFFQNKYTGIV